MIINYVQHLLVLVVQYFCLEVFYYILTEKGEYVCRVRKMEVFLVYMIYCRFQSDTSNFKCGQFAQLLVCYTASPCHVTPFYEINAIFVHDHKSFKFFLLKKIKKI